jgi:PEGA domain-containing protein
MRALLAAWVVLVALFAVPSRAQSPADVAIARQLFEEGTTALREGRFADARERFVRSLALKRTPLTLYSLAVSLRELGHYAESLETFKAFLAERASSADGAFEQPAREAIAELEQRVAYVRLRIEPAATPGMTVTVDGVTVPEAAIGYPRLVDPGSHVIRATAPGRLPSQKEVTLAEGQTVDVALELVPENATAAVPVPGPVPPSPAVPAPDPEPEPALAETEVAFPTGPVVVTAVGAAVFGVGLAVGLVGVSEAGDAPTRDGEEAAAARDKAVAGDVVAAIGAAGAAAGLVWLIVELTADPETAVARSAPPLSFSF